MGRFQSGLKKGPWTSEEDEVLIHFISKHGAGNWGALPKLAGLNRTRASCRSRWMNYLRPDIKRGVFSLEEEELIIKFHSLLGNKWSIIAARLPGRTDNEIRNFWYTCLKKKLSSRGIDPETHLPLTHKKFSEEKTDNDEIKNYNGFGERKGFSRPLTIQGESQFLEHDLENYVQGVGSQLIPSFSSAQPDNWGIVTGQGHEMRGELLAHIFGEPEECQTSEDDSPRLSNQPMDQKLCPDLVHDLRLRSREQEIGHDNLLPFPSFSSTQPGNLGNIPKQGHGLPGKLCTSSFGQLKKFRSCLPLQGESQGTTSTQFSDVVSESVMDYTKEFANDKIFKSKEALIQWAREIGKKNGFVIVIKRSDSGNLGGQKARVTFCCERGGQYRNLRKNKENIKERQLRNVNTKKCGCPFTLKGNLVNDDNWMLEVVCGMHNHPMSKPFKGRSCAGRLSKEETLLLVDMSKSMRRPKDILVTLKNRDVTNASTIKQIYNARQRYNKVIEMSGRSHMQQLLSKLSEHKYIEWHRSFDNSSIIKDLFWAHPVSIDLLHAFPHVLVMDTCKSNRYNLPLLEIKGVTSTNMAFVVAFACIEFEQEDNYMWALERLRSLMDDNALPTIILSDKELALMNAIARVFPTAEHLLSRWYISKDVLTSCKKFFTTNEIREKFIMSWNVVVLSSNEDEFTVHLNNLKKEFSNYPQAIEDVTNTWLKNYKERFVSVWTNKIMHFGNLTKVRFGSSHSMLKKQLCLNQGNFATSWVKIHSLLELQHRDIRASFEKSLTTVQGQFKLTEFKELRGFVSIDALHLILGELKRANSIGVDASTCGCIIRRTHGLPCAHEIAEFKRENRPIPLESIDSYWRKLDLIPISNKQKEKLSCESVLDFIAKRINECDDDTKFQILKKLIKIADLQSTSPSEQSLTKPEAKEEIHGQPSSKGDKSTPCDSSTFELELSGQENLLPTFTLKTAVWDPTSQVKKNKCSEAEVYRNKRLKSNTFGSSFPVGLQPYIHDIKDVVADGNCGFRAIADLMGFGENEWVKVRNDLLGELNSNSKHYKLVYGSEERVKELIHALSCFESCPSFDQWMTMPDMGHLIASAYNVVLFHLSLQQCLTFLPLKSAPIPTVSRKHIALGFIYNNHFVEVFLLPGHPIPPIATNWHKFHHPCANGWEMAYISRIQHFKKIISDDVAINEIIDVDSNSFSDALVLAAAIRTQ